MHKCKPKIQHVLLWSKKKEVVLEWKALINEYHNEYLYAITIEDIPTVISNTKDKDIEKEIEKYNFHVIKVHESHAELIRVDNKIHKVELLNIEDAIIILGKKVRAYAKKLKEH